MSSDTDQLGNRGYKYFKCLYYAYTAMAAEQQVPVCPLSLHLVKP